MMFMLTCKQASRLVSQSLDRPLSWSERARLRFHLFICDACTHFNRQLRLLSNAVKRMAQYTENDSAIQLSLEARDRISREINRSTDSGYH